MAWHVFTSKSDDYYTNEKMCSVCLKLMKKCVFMIKLYIIKIIKVEQFWQETVKKHSVNVINKLIDIFVEYGGGGGVSKNGGDIGLKIILDPKVVDLKLWILLLNL